MQNPDLEGRPVKIDDLIHGIPSRAHEFVDRRKIRSGFHFRIGVARIEEAFHVRLGLQKRAAHGERALVIEHVAVDGVARHIGGGEDIVEEIGVARVLVVNDVGNQHIADAPVERGCLADDVQAPQIARARSDAREQVIGGKTQGIVNVEDDGPAAPQTLQRQIVQPQIHGSGIQLRELDHLRLEVEGLAAGDAGDAVGGFVSGALLRQRRPFWRGEVLFEHVVEEVGPIAGHHPLTDAQRLGLQLHVAAVGDVIHELLLVALGKAGEHIRQAVRIAGDEVDILIVQIQRRVVDHMPPPTLGRAAIIHIRAGEQLHRQPLALGGNIG